MTVNVDEAIRLVGQSSLILLAVAALIFLSIRFVTTLRWFVLLRAYGVDISYLTVLRITFVSTAVGQFIPGGPDLVSIYQVFRESGKFSEISIAVFFDRLFGTAALLGIATIGVFMAVEEIWIKNLVLTIACIFVLAVLAVTSLIRSNLLRNVLSGGTSSKYEGVAKGARVATRILEILSNRSTLEKVAGPIVLASLTVQALRIMAFIAIYASLGEKVPAVYFVAFVPLVYLVTSFPISLAGLGVRETTLVVLFGTIGVAAEVSVAAGLLVPLLLLIGVLPGLILIATGFTTSGQVVTNPALSENHK
jgi:uncharacterized protein (TIRG00374 family)